jgi:integrase
MARVPRNKGSYAKRPGRDAWQIKIPLGWDDAKKKYDEYREEVGSEAEAIALIKEINDFLYHGGDIDEIAIYRRKIEVEDTGNAVTLKAFADEFCDMRAAQKNLAERTIRSDKECLNRIMPYLGKLPLKSITPRDLDQAYASMRSNGKPNRGEKGKRDKRGYSGTTLQKTHATLSMVFDKAIDYGYRTDNPCSKVKKPKRDTKEKESLSPQQAQELFTHITAHELTSKGVGVLISLSCGLRLSEMLALTWKDYGAGIISVNKSQEQDRQATKETKNGEERQVPCPPPLLPVLEDWRTQQMNWCTAHDLKWSEAMPIVHSMIGNHILQRSYNKWYEKQRCKYPIPNDFCFHGLRHTYVTLMNRDCGIDERTTRDMSGHKTNQAFQTYTHTNDEWKHNAASRLGSLIASQDDMKRCRNCRHWTSSPTDTTRGVCWANEEEGLLIFGAADECHVGRFEQLLNRANAA